MNITDAIRTAIKDKQIVKFTYEGRTRISEPHVLGIKNGVIELLMYQIGGQSSSGGLPDWRRVKVSKIQDFQIINEMFEGKRSTKTGQHSDFDTIIEIVG